MSSGAYDDVTFAEERNGVYAAACGIASITCAMTMGCTCYLSLVAGIALGGIALLLGSRTRATAVDRGAIAYANCGMITGAIGLGFSLLVSTLIALYLAFYVVILVFLAVAGNL